MPNFMATSANTDHAHMSPKYDKKSTNKNAPHETNSTLSVFYLNQSNSHQAHNNPHQTSLNPSSTSNRRRSA